MNNIKIDFKTLLTVSGILIAIGGFYYTTQMRLDSLESEVQILIEDMRSTRTTMDGVSKHMKRVSKRVTKLENKK